MDHKNFDFNIDDFLLSDAARKYMGDKYPDIYFALYNSYVSDEFLRCDDLANQAKGQLLLLGVATIGLAFAALSLAAIDIALLASLTNPTDFQKTLKASVPGAAAALGIFSFLVGFFGLGVKTPKRNWLLLRMKAELIRQWRARYYLNNMSVILAAVSSEDARKAYTSKQRKDFEHFTRKIDESSGAILQEMETGASIESLSIWLPQFDQNKTDAAPPEKIEDEAEKSFFSSYQEMRFDGQQRYATHIVQGVGKLRTHPRQQKIVTHKIETIALVCIVALHVSVTIGVLAGEPALKSVYIHLATVLFALFALASRAAADGLNFNENIRRYTGYLSKVQILKSTFERARTLETRLATAWAMEETASDEMVEFLAQFKRAKFVM